MFIRLRWGAWFVLGLLLLVLPAHAQTTAVAAFINSAGQLVVASGDGSYRWIVTNPGEALAEPLGYRWPPADDDRLFFAVDLGNGEVSLRMAEVFAQTAYEIGRASADATGGEWAADGQSILIVDQGTARLYPVDGSGAVDLGVVAARAISQFRAPASSLSASGDALLLQGNDGRYTLASLDGALNVALPGANDADAPNVGLWAPNIPLVAYWGYEASSVLGVANAQTGEVVTLEGGNGAPLTPLAWAAALPERLSLVYRAADGGVRLADVLCLYEGDCVGNPLDASVQLLPAAADAVQVADGWVYAHDGGSIRAVDTNCAAANDCLSRVVLVGANAAPETGFDVGAGLLVYTGFTANPNDPADREVRAVDVACLAAPDTCAPIPLLAGAFAGALSPDGGYLIIERTGGELDLLDVRSGATVYLSDPSNASLLPSARWGGG